MRLIDADVLIEYIRSRKFSGEARWGDFEDAVDDFPTAYDVEAVVAELETEREEASRNFHHYDDLFYLGKTFGLKRAINVVRNGGKE